MTPESVLSVKDTEDFNCFQKAEEKINSLLKNISLDECVFKDDSLTHEPGFWAPKGWAFKIIGCFEVGAHTGGDEFQFMETHPSLALWKLDLLTNPDYENDNKYFKQLIREGLTKKEAYEEVYEDRDKYYWPDKLPQSFIGKIIALPLLKRNGEFDPNKDLRLLIKKPAIINYTQECLGVIDIPYGTELKKILYDSNQANWINWSQMFAQIDLTNILTKCSITLIRNNKFDQEELLYIPKPKDTKVVTPYKYFD